jgi:hypothetical protein
MFFTLIYFSDVNVDECPTCKNKASLDCSKGLAEALGITTDIGEVPSKFPPHLHSLLACATLLILPFLQSPTRSSRKSSSPTPHPHLIYPPTHTIQIIHSFCIVCPPRCCRCFLNQFNSLPPHPATVPTVIEVMLSRKKREGSKRMDVWRRVVWERGANGRVPGWPYTIQQNHIQIFLFSY